MVSKRLSKLINHTFLKNLEPLWLVHDRKLESYYQKNQNMIFFKKKFRMVLFSIVFLALKEVVIFTLGLFCSS